MRHRVKEYDIIAPYAIDIAGNVTIEDIRLIVNETQGVVICSSMQKGNIVAISTGSESTTLSINPSVCTLNTDDILTIEIDKGDTLSSVESKVEEVGNKIDNIKLPEIDTTELAKQGENQEATNSAIFNVVKSIPDLSLLYSARFEKNDDGEDTYSMVLPIVAGVIANEDGETVTIKL